MSIDTDIETQLEKYGIGVPTAAAVISLVFAYAVFPALDEFGAYATFGIAVLMIGALVSAAVAGYFYANVDNEGDLLLTEEEDAAKPLPEGNDDS